MNTFQRIHFSTDKSVSIWKITLPVQEFPLLPGNLYNGKPYTRSDSLRIETRSHIAIRISVFFGNAVFLVNHHAAVFTIVPYFRQWYPFNFDGWAWMDMVIETEEFITGYKLHLVWWIMQDFVVMIISHTGTYDTRIQTLQALVTILRVHPNRNK